jgi:hypothetical protein
MPYRLKHGLWLPAAPAIITRRGGLAARKLTELPEYNFAPTPGTMPGKQVAAAGGGGSFGVTFTAANKDSTGATSITGLSFGAADTNRYMLAYGFARHGTNNLILGSVTIGGAGTTQVFNARRDGGADILAFAFVTTAALTSGTSGTVALTFSTGAPQHIAIAVYRIITTGAAPTCSGNGAASGSGTTATGNLTQDTTGTTPFVIYGAQWADAGATITPGGTGLTSPASDFTDTWASAGSLKVVSDDTPGVNAAATFNSTSSVSTVYVHGCCLVTP